MTPLVLVLVGTGAVTAGGLLALLLARVPRLGASAGAAAVALGCAVGLAGALAGLGAPARELAAAWQVPGGAIVVGLDPLSAFFLAPIFGLGALAAIYGRGYLGARPVAAGGLGLLVAAMALVAVARHALLFLVAWEAMTLLAYLLVTVDDEDPEVRRAGWIYLIAGHVALAALLALFLVLGAHAGGALDFAAIAAAAPAPAGLLVLALVGFGIKAGAAGVHVWLPEAHAAAPAHVSALMSGALIKLGLYGLLRVALLLPPPRWMAVTIMAVGVLGALLGIALALSQRDLKRVLAYSSVENVGVILLGIGLGLWLRGRGDPALAAVAFAGALLHVWNHAAMKGLMFLAAGSVVHGAGTRDVERLGGLMRRMPWTGGAMVVGAVAIAALPPLNGFTGEWLLYRALTEVGMGADAAAALAAIGGAALLALVGGLAALCFVRLTGVVLLGAPRSDDAAAAHESPPSMIIPIVALAAACVAAALAAPALVAAEAPLLAQLGASAPAAATPAAALAPLVTTSALLLAALALGALLVLARARRAARAETWGCGYAAPTPRMQYTGRSFAELVTARVLPRWLRPHIRARAPEGPFPAAGDFATSTTDPLTHNVYEPTFAKIGNRFRQLRFLQQGNVHVYIVYIVTTVIAALGWVVAREWWGAR